MRVNGGFSAGIFVSASGIKDASLRLANAAHRIANLNTPGFVPDTVTSSASAGGGVSSTLLAEASGLIAFNPTLASVLQPDLTTEQVNVLTAKAAYTANAFALSAGNESLKSLIKAVG